MTIYRVVGKMDNINSREELKEIINNNEMVLVYFANETCGVCVDMKPKIEFMLKKFPKVKSAYVQVEEMFKLASEYTIFTTPGILVFIEGKETIREARHISVQELEVKINRYYDLLFN